MALSAPVARALVNDCLTLSGPAENMVISTFESLSFIFKASSKAYSSYGFISYLIPFLSIVFSVVSYFAFII